MRITLKNGEVIFQVSEFPGCCGINVIHNVRFYAVESRIGLYKEFHEFITEDFIGHDRNKGMLLMSDGVGSSGEPDGYVKDFCDAIYDWEEYKNRAFNTNSDNDVVLYVCIRKEAQHV